MFLLGRISKSRGNSGEIVCNISPETEYSQIDLSGKFELRSKKHIKIAKMESYSERGSSIVFKFDISNSINDALGLVGYDIYLNESVVANTKLHLEGYTVCDVSGSDWGVVISVRQIGVSRIIEVRDKTDDILIPFDDSIVLEIDPTKKSIVIDPPDGLRDLNK